MPSETLTADITARVARTVPAGAAICVGFSGGLDSTVLLDLLSEDQVAAGRKVTALHVHHGLSPNADQWVKFCERFCANHGVPLSVEYVRVDATSPLGPEAAARAARYAVYAARSEPFIALAHHLDDQAETILLQLLRGTGLKGIAAMPELRNLPGTGAQIFRPLLEHSRAQLHAYAEERGLRWIEDESNLSTRPDRNFLRHDIGPVLDQRYAGWREAIARFARHAGAASHLLDQLASVDGAPLKAGEALPLNAALSADRRANVLRVFLARNAVAMPSEARLDEMARQLFDARDDARVRIEHAGVAIVRHRHGAMVDRHLEASSPGIRPMQQAGWRVDWRHENDVDLGADRGHVRFDSVVGQGIAADQTHDGEWYFASRAGGETIRLGSVDRPTRTLKNLLQEREIPMWQRDLPLLFHGHRLVWVPGIGIAAEYACEAGKPGLKPSWRVAGEGVRVLE